MLAVFCSDLSTDIVTSLSETFRAEHPEAVVRFKKRKSRRYGLGSNGT